MKLEAFLLETQEHASATDSYEPGLLEVTLQYISKIPTNYTFNNILISPLT